MGKAIATPKSNKRGPIIVKFWYNDVEPPKNYVWVRDDFYYIYQNHNWVPYEYEDLLSQLPVGCICEKIPTNSCNIQCSCIKYITSADLTDRLEKFQKELLAKIIKLINTSTSGDINVLDKYVKEQLEPRIEQLENNESNYLTSDALNGYATEQWVENKNYLTEHQSLNGYATEEFVNNAINSIEIPEPQVYDDTELRQIINDKELILSSSLNDLNDRIIAIESANYATEDWVKNNATIPASNVTCNISSDAFDFSNVNDGLIALVNKAEDLENNITGVDTRISDLESNSVNIESLNDVKTEINNKIVDDELVISASLNDLNDRIIEIKSSNSNYATKNYVDNAISNIPAGGGDLTRSEMQEYVNNATSNKVSTEDLNNLFNGDDPVLHQSQSDARYEFKFEPVGGEEVNPDAIKYESETE